MNARYLFFFSLAVLMAGCFSPLKQIKDPNTPFDRPSYSILAPSGKDWGYEDSEEGNGFTIWFIKKFNSNTHKLAGRIAERRIVEFKFKNPEEFLSIQKKAMELDQDPVRYHVLEEDVRLTDKFGPYSVQFYFKKEDYNAINAGGETLQIFETYGYVFMHPYFENTAIDVRFSEQGIPNEIDSDFKKNAQKFIERLSLKR